MGKDINDSAYWREFEKNELTHSAAHYLMAIDSLRGSLGYARVTDVAEMLEVSRGAASMAITHLKKRKWVKEDPNRFLLLTEEGLAMASIVEHNFRILSKFFESILSVSHDVALADACKMEHLMSLETGRRLLWFMRFVLGDADRAKALEKHMKSYQLVCDKTEDCPLCEGVCLVGPEYHPGKAEV